jgi:hypothetical protein
MLANTHKSIQKQGIEWNMSKKQGLHRAEGRSLFAKPTMM